MILARQRLLTVRQAGRRPLGSAWQHLLMVGQAENWLWGHHILSGSEVGPSGKPMGLHGLQLLPALLCSCHSLSGSRLTRPPGPSLYRSQLLPNGGL